MIMLLIIVATLPMIMCAMALQAHYPAETE
jgi:hypothetical protein